MTLRRNTEPGFSPSPEAMKPKHDTFFDVSKDLPQSVINGINSELQEGIDSGDGNLIIMKTAKLAVLRPELARELPTAIVEVMKQELQRSLSVEGSLASKVRDARRMATINPEFVQDLSSSFKDEMKQKLQEDVDVLREHLQRKEAGDTDAYPELVQANLVQLAVDMAIIDSSLINDIPQEVKDLVKKEFEESVVTGDGRQIAEKASNIVSILPTEVQNISQDAMNNMTATFDAFVSEGNLYNIEQQALHLATIEQAVQSNT